MNALLTDHNLAETYRNATLMIKDLQAVAQRNQLFVLKHGKPVRVTNPLEWIDWMNRKTWLQEKTILSDQREVHTSFMGYCGETRDGKPLTFATMLRSNTLSHEFAITLEWYYSRDEAKAGHARHVEQFTNTYKPNRLRYTNA